MPENNLENPKDLTPTPPGPRRPQRAWGPGGEPRPARDRPQLVRELALNVGIIVERSTQHPAYYAIVLGVTRDGTEHAVVVFDNAHRHDEHHEHHDVNGAKVLKHVTHGPWVKAMTHAVETLIKEWPGIVDHWEEQHEHGE